MKLNKTYIILTLILLTIEVLIAIYLKTGFIRHTVGDYLCVILLYCFFKSFIVNNHFKIAIMVLLVAYTVEFLQLTNYLALFNLQDNYLCKLVLGSTFQVLDLVAYTLGIISTLFFEYKFNKL
ncbi:DUF2809 domain-containing protein [Algibacter sp. PT7-4]|uniref:ribosomal maturation YjgA family protein n=1 Tax=Algibacter ulvanivorans TaxID=3400999 RepID=UPI003AAC6805